MEQNRTDRFFEKRQQSDSKPRNEKGDLASVVQGDLVPNIKRDDERGRIASERGWVMNGERSRVNEAETG